MKRVAFILPLLLGACTTVPTLEVNAIRLTSDEMAQCMAGGGCLVIPRNILQRYVEQLQGCRKKDWI